MKRTLRELAQHLGSHLLGDSSIGVTAVSSVSSATAESLVFVEDSKYLSAALGSPAAAVVAGDFAAAAYAASAVKPLLISPQPRLAFARAARFLRDLETERTIHPTAVVASSAKVGRGVAIAARTVIGERVTIGDGSTIGAGVVIADDVSIGKDCRIDPNVTIYAKTVLGDRVVVQAGAVLGSDGFGYVRDAKTGCYEQFPQIGRLVIEDDVEIGANSTIDRGALDETRIRRGTKLDNLVHIGHNVEIGEDVVMAAQVGLSGSVTVADGVIMGGQVGIGDHARIEEGAILGGQCGILPKKILRGKGVVFWGTPAHPLKEYLKELAYVSRAAKKSGE
jgi:UDP-3-O-[3-hydroxymyristoyl] glucosamine N-acyltransferase